MRFTIRLALFGVVLSSWVLPGCSNVSGADTRIRKGWSAGDTDPFGCPVVDPVPWASSEAHQEFCGEACTPIGGRGASQGDNGLSFFVACASDDIPPWSGGDFVSAITVCLTSPVNDRDYVFANPKTAWPLGFICWPPCGSDVLPDPSLDHEVPAECFEASP
jgi:hypothetical protein